MYGPLDGWGIGMMLISLLFLALIVLGAVFIIRSVANGGQPAPPPQGNRALDILDERFTRGEIDRQEYEERRGLLTGAR